MTNPLQVIPAKLRQSIYAALVVAASIFAAFQAADGDWDQFIGGALTALINLMAASNVKSDDEV